jgi:hypothetical protein
MEIPMTARLVSNFLAICGAAMFAGAMLTIGLSFGSYWKSLTPEAFLDWFSQNSHVIGQTIPLFIVPTLFGLAFSIWLGWNEPGRIFWLLAAACFAGVLVITVVYHLPTNSAFTAKSIPLDQVGATLNMWLALHALRVALGLGAAVLGFLAMPRPG